MTIWLRRLGEEGYQLRTVDSLDGLCCEGRDEETGYYLYYELPDDEPNAPESEPRQMCCDKGHWNEAGGICCPEHYPNTCGYH